LIRTVDKSGTNRIGFDVSANVEKLKLTGHGDVPVPLLIDVTFANRSVAAMNSPNVRTGEPVHVRRKCAKFIWSQDQVKVIRHGAVREQRDVESLTGLAKEREKLFVVIVLVEQALAPIATIHDVLNMARDDSPAGSGHDPGSVCRMRNRNLGAIGCW
jgi:hypothetical protein